MTGSEANSPEVVEASILAERLSRHEPVTVLEVRRPERWSEDRDSGGVLLVTRRGDQRPGGAVAPRAWVLASRRAPGWPRRLAAGGPRDTATRQ